MEALGAIPCAGRWERLQALAARCGVDLALLGPRDQLARGLDRCGRYEATFARLVEWTEAGTIPESRIHHSRFRDFCESPLETTRGLYERFDLPWSEGLEARFRSVLSENPRERHGGHAYTRDDLGEAPETLRPRFVRYQRTFDVPDDA